MDCLAEYTQGLEPAQGLGGLFGLSCHPALAGLSIAALREMEEEEVEAGGGEGEERVRVRHEGPVTQRSLAVCKRAVQSVLEHVSSCTSAMMKYQC